VDSSYVGAIKVVYILNIICIIAAFIITDYLIKKFKEKKKLEKTEE